MRFICSYVFCVMAFLSLGVSDTLAQTLQPSAIQSVDILLRDRTDRSILVQRFLQKIAQQEQSLSQKTRPLKMTVIFSDPNPPTPGRYVAHLFLHDRISNQQQQSVQVSGVGNDPAPLINYLQRLQLDGYPLQFASGASQRQAQSASPPVPKAHTNNSQHPLSSANNLDETLPEPLPNEVLAQQALQAVRTLVEVQKLNNLTRQKLNQIVQFQSKKSPNVPFTKTKRVPQISEKYVIQLAAYRQRTLALKRLKDLSARLHSFSQNHAIKMIQSHIATQGTLYRLHMTNFTTLRQAQQTCRKVKQMGYDCFARKKS